MRLRKIDIQSLRQRRAQKPVDINADIEGAALLVQPVQAEAGVQPGATDVRRKAVCAAIAALLFLGVSYVLAAICRMDQQVPAMIVAWASAAAIIAATCWACGKGKAETKLGYAVLGILVAMLAVWPLSSGGCTQALNGLLYTLGAQTGNYQLQYAAGSELGLVWFTCAIAVGLSYLCAQLALHGGRIACAAIAVVAAVLMILGYVPATGWAIVLAAGIVGAMCSGTLTRTDLQSGRALFAGTGFAVAAGAVLATIVLLVAGTGTLDTSAPRQALRQLAYAIQYGGASFAMPMGQLEGLGALSFSDRPALEVKVNSDTSEYLRGFVGESYDGKQWQALSGDAMTQNEGLFYWLSEDGFSTISQLSAAADASAFSETDQQGMGITYQGARGGYAYLPYSYASGADTTTSTSMATATAGSTESSQIVADSTLLRKSYRLQEVLTGQESSATGDLQTYLDDESAYRRFVYENYLDVPDETMGTFESLFGEASTLSTEEAKLQVMADLDACASYDEGGQQGSSQQDFVTYFLTTSHAGYSVHYATAATLMLRYYGVPARYVEGYVLDTQAQKADYADAEARGQSVPEDGTYELTEGDAHAWAEYYLDGVGWVPFDPTPGYRDNEFYEATDQTSVQYEGSLWSNGSTQGTASWAPETQSAQDQNAYEEQMSFAFMMILWSLLGFAIVLLMALGARTYIIRKRLAAYLDELQTRALDKAVPRGFSYGLLLGEKCLGIQLENEPYRQQAQAVENAGLCGAQTFERAADANSRALFGGIGELTEDDRQAMLGFVDEVKGNVDSRCNFAKKLVQRYIRGLW